MLLSILAPVRRCSIAGDETEVLIEVLPPLIRERVPPEAVYGFESAGLIGAVLDLSCCSALVAGPFSQPSLFTRDLTTVEAVVLPRKAALIKGEPFELKQ